MFDTLENLYLFFSASSKRYDLLNIKLSKIEKLRNLSKTRWTTRVESVNAVWGLLEAIIKSLDEVLVCSDNGNFDKGTISKVFGLQKQLLSFYFIVSIIVMKNIMYKLKCLTETLKTKNLCIIYTIALIGSTIDYKY
jgi:hypothetical protein